MPDIPLLYHCFADDLDHYTSYEGSADSVDGAIAIAVGMVAPSADIYQTRADGGLRFIRHWTEDEKTHA